MLKTTKFLLASASIISLAANVAFATDQPNKPLCVVDKHGELIGTATHEQAQAACQDSISAGSSYSFAAALSGPANTTPKDICKVVDPQVDPIPFPTPMPDPIIPPCPQPTCEQKLGVVIRNLDLCEASTADFSIKVEELNGTIAAQAKTIADLAAKLKAAQCRLNPKQAMCKKAINPKTNKKNAATKESTPAS